MVLSAPRSCTGARAWGSSGRLFSSVKTGGSSAPGTTCEPTVTLPKSWRLSRAERTRSMRRRAMGPQAENRQEDDEQCAAVPLASKLTVRDQPLCRVVRPVPAATGKRWPPSSAPYRQHSTSRFTVNTPPAVLGVGQGHGRGRDVTSRLGRESLVAVRRSISSSVSWSRR